MLFDTTFIASFRLRKVLENAVLRPSCGDSSAPGQSRGTRLVNSKTKSLQENQKDLETATETLSEYLERDISAENLVDIKQKVQDKYR